MGLLATIDHSIRAEEQGNHGPLDDFWYGDPGMDSDSGIRISPEAAMRISTVWKCINWWFRMYGTLPHKLKERVILQDRPSMREAVDHPLYDLIHTAPNPMMTSEYFFGLIPVDKKLNGAFYAFIQRNPSTGRVQYLWRLRPDMVTMKVVDKQLWYEVRGDDGLPKRFYPDEILHLPAVSLDGRTGLSTVRSNHNVLGWNRATTRYGAQFFKNASRPSGIISTAVPIKDKDTKAALLNNLSMSGKEAGKLLLIEGAVTFQKLTMDQDEAQFILTCNMQEEDICGDFEVFPHEIGINRNLNNSITEQLTINTVTRHMAPFCVQVEQQMNLQLLSDVPSSGRGGGTERSRYFFQDELKSLMRGDTAAQTAHLTAMFDRGIYDGNACSEYLGNEPYEGGDVRFINRAYGPVDMARQWSKVSQNNPTGRANSEGSAAPSENVKSELVPLDAFAETETRVRESYSFLFADAAGRVASRKKPGDRERSAPAAFRAILSGLAHALNVKVNSEFVDDYIGALAQRATLWESDSVAAEELNRAVEALIEHGKSEEYREGKTVNG